MLRKLLISTAIVAISSTLTHAADPVPVDDPVPPVIDEARFDWTGGYVGGFVGYGFGDTEHINLGDSTGGLDIKGFVGGATIGYDWQFDNIVVGIEADIAGSGISGSHGPATFGPFTCGTGPCETEVDWIANFRARLGVANNNWLFYAVGGIAYAGVDARISNDPTLQAGSDTVHGWTYGGGLEYAFGNNWTTRLEYTYTDLGSWRYDSNSSDFNATAEFSTVKFGVNYRF